MAAGVDGCRAGWIAALAFDDAARPQRTELRLFESIGEVVSWREQQETKPVVAVDVPMGLPQAVDWRGCDKEAQACLGARRSCVFPVPDRELLLHAHDFESARAIVHARRAEDPQATFRVLSTQGAGILNKIAEVDEVLREEPARQDWLVEVHPEVSFRALANEDLPKKKSRAGKERRQELLREHFSDVEAWLEPDAIHRKRREVGKDDMLDAYSALWSALRFARGRHCELGNGERELGNGERDAGLAMRMIV